MLVPAICNQQAFEQLARKKKIRNPAEMSRLWSFSVRVQSWSPKVESDPVLICKIFENHQSDPVLIRPYKTMYFILTHEAKQPREAK